MLEFILFVLVVILLFWVGSLSGRLGKLEQNLRTAKTAPGKNDEPAAASVLVARDYNSLDARKGLSVEQNLSGSTIAPVNMTSPEVAPAAQQEPFSSNSLQPSYSWLTKFGVLAIALGIIFFFKFAIDQGWISEWMRIIFGFAIGVLFVYLGELWKEKYAKYSYALSGGGILILDFTIYAAFNFYHLMPQFISLLLMVAVSAGAVWLSLKRKSLALVVLGIVGAYGAPLFLSTGENQQVMLFFFLTILSLAVFAVLFSRFWAELALLAFVGTILDFSVWASGFSSQANTWTSITFVIVTIVLYGLVAAILFRKHAGQKTLPQDADKNFGILNFFCGMFFLISIWMLLNQNFHSYLSIIALLGAVIWWISYILVDRLEFSFSNHALSLAGSALVVGAAYWQFTGKTFDAILIALALLGLLVGYFAKRREIRTWGTLILYLSLIIVTFEPYGAKDTQFLLNAKFALMLLETAALVFTGWLYSKIDITKEERQMQSLCEVVAGILLWVAVSWDISNSFQGLSGNQSMSLWWVLYPPLLAWLAFLGKRRALAVIALLLLVVGAFRVLILPYDQSGYVFLFNAKFGLMFLETLGFLAIAALQASRPEDKKDMGTADLLKIFAALYLWFAVSWEIVQYYSLAGSSQNVRNLLLSVWWMSYGVVLMLASSVKGFSVYRKVAVGFFCLAIAKVFLYDVAFLDIGYRVVSFIVLGVILLSVSFAYQKNKEKITQFLTGDKARIIS